MNRSVDTRIAVAFLLTLLIGAAAVCGAEPAIVKILDGCSGVCVSDEGHILTAKHCEHGQTEMVTFPTINRTVPARRVYVSPQWEGPVVFECEGDGFPYLPMASGIAAGDRVQGLGYPGADASQFVVRSGNVTGALNHRGVVFNTANFAGIPGMSGGPLVNSRNEVVGLLHGTRTDGTPESLWISYAATRNAYNAAVLNKRTTLVAFSAPLCGPCERFKEDVADGHFAAYDVVVVEFDPASGQWSRPDLYREFQQATGQSVSGTPTFWIRGTSHTKAGYDSGSAGRQGILGWIASLIGKIIGGVGKVIGGVGEVIAGDPAPAPAPITPVPIQPIQLPPDTPPEVATLAQQLAALKASVEAARADVEKFKGSGIIGKAKLIGELKDDAARLKSQVAEIRASGGDVVDAAKRKPSQFLFAILGAALGIAKRRYAH